jgi:DNA-binding MarR family transcriptional regulator
MSCPVRDWLQVRGRGVPSAVRLTVSSTGPDYINIRYSLDVPRVSSDESLDVDRLATAIEDFNTVFIRLASVQRLSFSTLSVLHSLSRSGPMRLTGLLATEQIKQPALTSLVSKLEASGLVSRAPDPSDGRAVLLSLTEAGEMVVASRHADRVAMLARLIERLDVRDRTVLTAAQGVLFRLVALAGEAASEPSEFMQGQSRTRGRRG